MAERLGRKLGGMFDGLRRKAEGAVARQEAAFARGKVAGSQVVDDAGATIVDAGHIIDEAVIARAERAGKLHAVAAAAGSGQLQDLREKASDAYGASSTGREARALDSIDDYVAARRYVGRIAAVDVTDVRGSVLVPAGKEIKEEDVRLCREAGLLAALVYSAQQSPPPPMAAGPASPTVPSDPAEYSPRPATPTPRRAPLPVVKPPSGDEGA